MNVTEKTKVKLDKLKQEFESSCFNLIAEEASLNNPYKRGDILQDHFLIGEVIKSTIKINLFNNSYRIIYDCNRLNEQLKPYRGGEECEIHLDKVKDKLNKSKNHEK